MTVSQVSDESSKKLSPLESRIADVFDKICASGLTGLPVRCARGDWPGVVDKEPWQDWTNYATTEDQTRIERNLSDFVDASSHILHIGIGNSRLADAFTPRVASITGISISPAEVAFGLARRHANYRVFLGNKFRYREDHPAPGFDAIVDNNPTSFACCFRHLAEMFAWYADSLHAEGAIFTDRLGLGWILDTDDTGPTKNFAYADWRTLSACLDLEAVDIDGNVYAMIRPTGRARMDRLVQIAAARPRPNIITRIARRGIRRIKRILE